MKLLSTKEAGERLGITPARVQKLIWEGRLPATQVGRAYIIREEDLKLVEVRKAGRPKKDSMSNKTTAKSSAPKKK